MYCGMLEEKDGGGELHKWCDLSLLCDVMYCDHTGRGPPWSDTGVALRKFHGRRVSNFVVPFGWSVSSSKSAQCTLRGSGSNTDLMNQTSPQPPKGLCLEAAAQPKGASLSHMQHGYCRISQGPWSTSLVCHGGSNGG